MKVEFTKELSLIEKSIMYTNSNHLLEKYDELEIEYIKHSFFKRLFDIIISLSFILLFSIWLFPIIAILIRMETKGNPFYKQLRRGLNGRNFMCWKFRTMNPEFTGPYRATIPNDPRVTKIGKILRKTNLDEIPQIINVLFGNMSLVGPRPLPIEECMEYEKYIPNFNKRHIMKPGITGFAQINNLRGNEVDFDENRKRIISRTKYDLYYIKHYSFGFDLKIIFSTVINMIIRNEDIH